jgi:hypothetical protein
MYEVFVPIFIFNIYKLTRVKSTCSSDKGKGKAIPVQAWTGPDGSRRVRIPDLKTIGT